MSAELGNKYAEKWDLESTIDLFERAIDTVSPTCFYLASVCDELEIYPDLIKYLTKKFENEEKVFRLIKRLYVKCERIITEKTGDGDISVPLGIFILKAYHGLIETSKQQIEANVVQDSKIDLKNLDDAELLQLTRLQQKAKGD